MRSLRWLIRKLIPYWCQLIHLRRLRRNHSKGLLPTWYNLEEPRKTIFSQLFKGVGVLSHDVQVGKSPILSGRRIRWEGGSGKRWHWFVMSVGGCPVSEETAVFKKIWKIQKLFEWIVCNLHIFFGDPQKLLTELWCVPSRILSTCRVSGAIRHQVLTF